MQIIYYCEIANKFFSHSIHKEPSCISSAHGSSAHKLCTLVACGKIFKISDLKLKFHLFDFHSFFDGLIGLDNLELLNATIDITRDCLRTPNCKLLLYYRNTNINSNYNRYLETKSKKKRYTNDYKKPRRIHTNYNS